MLGRSSESFGDFRRTILRYYRGLQLSVLAILQQVSGDLLVLPYVRLYQGSDTTARR
jgi:hypothetical protein